MPQHDDPTSTRRDFLKGSSGVLAAAGVASLASSLGAVAHAGGDSTLRIALVGCGGRGTGAAEQALETERTLALGKVQLVAIADAFADRVAAAKEFWRGRHAAQCDLPDERCFVGFDAYRHAIDAVAPGGVALLATPACFRAIHMEYAVQKGVHVFIEKAFGVDAPNLRRLIAAGEVADQKGLKVVGGLMSRYAPYNIELMQRVHDGAIGEIAHLEVCRMHGPVPLKLAPDGLGQLEYQIRHQWGFGWVGGTFILDWLIHGIDLACWMKDAWPVSAQGMGGRQLRRHPDTAFDHWAVQYTFADGATMIVNGRDQQGVISRYGNWAKGAAGSAYYGEAVNQPALFGGWNIDKERMLWRHQGPNSNAYQIEHDVLFRAIREDTPHNDTMRCAMACLAGIMGRMAAESGQDILAADALACTTELCPGLDALAPDSPAPVQPDEHGRYPVAMPGVTRPA